MGVSQQRKAVYLGTFDPLTLGHLDIITRASRMFDQLILGIGVNSSKSPCFELEERLDMVRGICAHLPNIHIDSFQGLAVNFAKNHDARIMVRGLRTEADYAYEMQMAMMNHILSSGIEPIFIPIFVPILSPLRRNSKFRMRALTATAVWSAPEFG